MKTYELLDSKEKWMQGDWSADKDGSYVACTSERAACWCVAGAFIRCYPDIDERDGVIEKLRKKIELQSGLSSIFVWNDAQERTYEEVYSVLKELDI